MSYVAVCYGTRPEWIKVRPVISALELAGISVKVYKIAQHDTLFPGDEYYDFMISVDDAPGNRLNNIIKNVLGKIEFRPGCELVLVQGDTASAFACALAAFNCEIPVGHIEAGLRTENPFAPFPEESYRAMIGAFSYINFCPTSDAEVVSMAWSMGASHHNVGNTVLDNLREYGIEPTDDGHVVVTVHRSENRGSAAENLYDVLSEIDSEKTFPIDRFIWVKHPGMSTFFESISEDESTIEFIDPLPHIDLCKLVASSSFIITDSGGLVEESSFYGKKSIVVRAETEREEAVAAGYSQLINPHEPPAFLIDEISEAIKDAIDFTPTSLCPFGDGRSSARIVDIVKKFIEEET